MLTRRYALYIMVAGLALLLAGVGVGFAMGVVLALLVVFNGLLVLGGGVWMWIAGGDAI